MVVATKSVDSVSFPTPEGFREINPVQAHALLDSFVHPAACCGCQGCSNKTLTIC